ncbi:amino acid ABC transporter permease [Pelagibius sp. Alg239-R121]|uniref:amino acid ABC transporter permease n=1 Tax=Pelagibius sp. Alg239-R121 TaxID=2993448 RepID=UPI0024A615C5|nr:amino acid ABC transporter permease [Pelagibius sp. Alg239-R121]
MQHTWDFATIFQNWEVLWVGLKGTVVMFLVTVVLGLSGGLVVGMGRYAQNSALRWPATAFVEIFRNTPVLVQIIWFYYAFPILTGIEVNPFLAAVLGISLNTMAFSAEIYRAGIQSIEPGQWEAGKAIGMTYGQTLRRIIMPVAIKRILPALTNRGIEVFKMSTLASVVAYVETLNQAKLIADLNFNPIESYTAVALIFFVVLYPVVQATYALERTLRKSD